MPYLYPGVHAATVRVLRRSGCQVVVPLDQVCCGALNVHAGERRLAREMARRNVQAFLQAEVEAIVVNAAGCGSTLKEYAELLASDAVPEGRAPASLRPAERFARMVKDVNEFLAATDLAPPQRAIRRRASLQESCHLLHAQRVIDAPRQLLARIPGLVLVEMAHPDRCCGSAGIYNLTQPEMSADLLASRMAEIEATGADTVVTTNPGCQLQLEHGARERGRRLEVRHVVELLDAAYVAR
jgi:glycolate oxidase iron-sulfur subunit